MDAVKFLEERKRMCEAHPGCPGCPAFRGVDSCIFRTNTSASPSDQVELVEDWSITHPPKTRQSEFLKLYPRTRLDSSGVIAVKPCDLGIEVHGCESKACYMCRKEYWLSPED